MVVKSSGDNLIVVTHKPSGIQASCLLSLYRSQHKCREAALKLLQSRLWAANQIVLSESELTWVIWE